MKYALLLAFAAMLPGCGLEYGVYEDLESESGSIELELVEPAADATVYRTSPDVAYGEAQIMSTITPANPEWYPSLTLPFEEDPEYYIEAWNYFQVQIEKSSEVKELRLVLWPHYHAGADATEPFAEGQEWWGPITLEMYLVESFNESTITWATRPAEVTYIMTLELDDLTARPNLVPESDEEWLASGADISPLLEVMEGRDTAFISLVPIPVPERGYPFIQQFYPREVRENAHYGEAGYEHRQVPRLVVVR